MSTYMPKPGEIKANWHLVDASGLVLGRLAAKIAMILQGKEKPTYSPFVETGDCVVVVNVEKIRVTGNKAAVLEYDTYSHYPTGRRVYTYEDLADRRPAKLLELAVRRMLPKNRIGRKMLLKLKIYTGGEHPHAAQQPTELKLA